MSPKNFLTNFTQRGNNWNLIDKRPRKPSKITYAEQKSLHNRYSIGENMFDDKLMNPTPAPTPPKEVDFPAHVKLYEHCDDLV